MKIISKKGSIESAPRAYVRISFTEKPTDATRVLRENGIETIEVGAGKFSELNRRKFIILCRSVVRTARAHKAKKIALQFDRTPTLF